MSYKGYDWHFMVDIDENRVRSYSVGLDGHRMTEWYADAEDAYAEFRATIDRLIFVEWTHMIAEQKAG